MSLSKSPEVSTCGKGNWFIKNGKVYSKTKKGEIIQCRFPGKDKVESKTTHKAEKNETS